MTQDRETSAGERSGAGESVGTENARQLSLLELASILFTRWKLVAGLPLMAAFFAVVISLIMPAKYEATSTFVPEPESDDLNISAGLAGLAAQFGVAVPGAGAQSPQFYADLLRSRTIRDEVLLSRFGDPRTESNADSATLLDLLKVRGKNETDRLERGRDKLDQDVVISVDQETGIVALTVETRYRSLSADVSNLFIELVNHFNQMTRQSSAQERRQFIEDRMAEVGAELHGAEEDIRSFLERNRQFQGSPELSVQYERLQRQVMIKQEVFTTLRREYEEARIQEVDDTPVITVIDRAIPPEEQSSPDLKLNLALALILGGVFGVLGAFSREYADRARAAEDRDYAEFASRWAAMRADMRATLFPFRRRTRS